MHLNHHTRKKPYPCRIKKCTKKISDPSNRFWHEKNCNHYKIDSNDLNDDDDDDDIDDLSEAQTIREAADHSKKDDNDDDDSCLPSATMIRKFSLLKACSDHDLSNVARSAT
jgi:hypothetical protein